MIHKPVMTEKPWGKEALWALTDEYAAKLLHVDADRRLSFQYHERKRETLLCLSGSGTMRIGDDSVFPYGRGAIFHVDPGTKHRIEAATDSVFVEVSTPELDDVVRIEDEYGRT